MRSGNADLGAGLTQTSGKRVDEAKHLAKHQSENVKDMWFRVAGLAAAIVWALAFFLFFFGAVAFWVSIVISVGPVILAVIVALLLKLNRNKRRDLQMADFRRKQNEQ